MILPQMFVFILLDFKSTSMYWWTYNLSLISLKLLTENISHLLWSLTFYDSKSYSVSFMQIYQFYLKLPFEYFK